MLSAIILSAMFSCQLALVALFSTPLFHILTQARLLLDPPNLATEALFARVGMASDKWLVEAACRGPRSRFVRLLKRDTNDLTAAERLTLFCSFVKTAPAPEDSMVRTVCNIGGKKQTTKQSVTFFFSDHRAAMTFANVWGNYRNFRTPKALSADVPTDIAQRQELETWEELLEKARIKAMDADDEVNLGTPVKFVTIGDSEDKFVLTRAYRLEDARIARVVEHRPWLWDIKEDYACGDVVEEGGTVTAMCIPKGGTDENTVKLTFHFNDLQDASKFKRRWGAPLRSELKEGESAAPVDGHPLFVLPGLRADDLEADGDDRGESTLEDGREGSAVVPSSPHVDAVPEDTIENQPVADYPTPDGVYEA
ncbi:hypothetical protein FOL47_003495 [Perkinsus chesapeaki]|uniref:Uncharacterized protein n=1 Tax=Perkinsus chesapeaki TaxID=330153 RepID=A0A7J6M7I1_PERCH|nr:hypothetical protein FOL47_003495 [Perkinsus chesapeaki]